MLQAVPVPVVAVDTEDRVRFWNRAAQRAFGWTAEEVLGQPYPLVPEDAEEHYRSLVERARAGEEIRGEVVRRRRRDGELLDVQVWTAPVYDDEGRLRGAIGILQDVTERTRMETELRRKEERFRALFHQAADAMFLHEPGGGRIVDVNREACESLGYDRDELLDIDIREIVVESGPKERLAKLPALEPGQRLGGLWGVHRRKDGTRFPVEVEITMVEREGERLSLAIARDVSERRRIEASLLEANEMLNALVNAAPVAVVMVDDADRLVRWNPAAERILGWSAEEVVGRRNPAIPPEDRDTYREIYEEVERGEAVAGREVVGRTRSGKTLRLRLWAAPIRSAEGEIQGSMAIFEDVSERARIEEELRLAQKMQAVGELAGGVAHDFNNRLTTILGLTSMMVEDVDETHPFREDLEEIRRAAESAADLTQQLLAYGRRQIQRPVILHMNEVIREMESVFRRVLPESIRLVLDLDPEAGSVEADPGQVKEVVLNLVVNARDAMPRGGTLTLRTLRQPRDEAATPPEGGPWVRLEVEDTGEGIGPEIRDRIFEPFFTTKDVGEGTGLGLSTVYGIVEQNEGRVTVESTPGRGTTFVVCLPRTEPPTEEE